jgi:CheY-like chemotaxis protein
MISVLLIEDDKNYVALLEDIFTYDNMPAQLVVATTGEEAMRRAVEMRPALILMDLRLPGIDGVEATQSLKSNPLTKDIPIWATTAYGSSADREIALAAGCCNYITKPLCVRELADKLRDFLTKHAAAQGAKCVPEGG